MQQSSLAQMYVATAVPRKMMHVPCVIPYHPALLKANIPQIFDEIEKTWSLELSTVFRTTVKFKIGWKMGVNLCTCVSERRRGRIELGGISRLGCDGMVGWLVGV